MMDTPFYALCKADPLVISALGGPEPRIYPFGEAPQAGAKPYAVYSAIDGMPYNTMNCRPKTDWVTLQVDVYADSSAKASTAANAIRHAIELNSYIKRYNGSLRDPETKLYRVSFDVDFISPR